MNILIFDDDEVAGRRLQTYLAARGLAARRTSMDPAARADALVDMPDIVITELAPEPEEPAAPIVEAKAMQPDSQVLVFTARPSLETAVEAIRRGAVDYLIKGEDDDSSLANAIERAVIHRALLSEHRMLLDALTDANARLVDLANRDGLTGLYNYRFFEPYGLKELDRARRRNGQVALIMLDIDFFKQINDSYGHRAGDEVLREFGRTLLSNVRASDLVARYGGEEFVALLPETNLEGAAQLASKLCRAVCDMRVRVDSKDVRITMSAGVAVYPDAATDLEGLVSAADVALYRAKESGRNRFEFAA